MSLSNVAERWFEEVWNKGNIDAIDELLAEKCCVTDLDDNTICDRAAMKQFFEKMNGALEGINIEIEKMIETGNQIAAIFVINATMRSTQKKVKSKSAVIAKIEDGKIVEANNVVDFLGMFIQGEVLPADAVAQGLMTGRIEKAV